MLRRGLLLTIGLPLVAGLSVRQFGGVLAHEFGHFAQGSGMRVTALVRQINYWFARVVFERDHWDAKLDAWSRNNDWRALIVVNLARAAVGASRLVLKGLMKIGHAVSSFLLRQILFTVVLAITTGARVALSRSVSTKRKGNQRSGASETPSETGSSTIGVGITR